MYLRLGVPAAVFIMPERIHARPFSLDAPLASAPSRALHKRAQTLRDLLLDEPCALQRGQTRREGRQRETQKRAEQMSVLGEGMHHAAGGWEALTSLPLIMVGIDPTAHGCPLNAFAGVFHLQQERP